MTDFEAAVAAVLRALPAGGVVTYGEVASEAGYPGAARAVGALLARDGDAHPWWRVVTTDGRLVPGHEIDHARRLRGEGVEINDGRVAAMGRRRPVPAVSPGRDARHTGRPSPSPQEDQCPSTTTT